MTLAENRKRARSQDEKEARRGAILEAARAMIGEQGFDGVTMSALAKRAGLAKGTLYLYVRTKEELFLALFVEALGAMAAEVAATATADTLAEALTHAARETPLFLPLFARLSAVIEANVDDAALFAAKREINALTTRVAQGIGGLLGLEDAAAAQVSYALILAMQGAAQFDISAARPPETLPDDLREVFAAHAFERAFPAAARVILSGATR